MSKRKIPFLEKASHKLTHWIGTPHSIIVHTALFFGSFLLMAFGISIDKILLVLTTIVSLEAIYLAIFIQMTVNRTTQSLAGVEKDIDDIQDDVDSIEENVKGITEDYAEDDVVMVLKDVEKRLVNLQDDIAILKKKGLF